MYDKFVNTYNMPNQKLSLITISDKVYIYEQMLNLENKQPS